MNDGNGLEWHAGPGRFEHDPGADVSFRRCVICAGSVIMGADAGAP